MRSGAGLVTLGLPKSLNSAVIKIKSKEVMTLPLPETREITLSRGSFTKIKDFIKKIDVLVLGPGLTQNKSTERLVSEIIIKIEKPMVIDADALVAFEDLSLLKLIGAVNDWPDKIITPHPGEMAKLLGVSVSKVQSRRKEIARDFAMKHRLTVVLKGRNTVAADYRGNLYINKTGNPGMSTAGSGDVLTGIIAAFLGQGLEAFEAVKYGVYLHGLAGDLAAGEKTQLGAVASDIIDKIPKAIKQCS